MPRVNSQYVNKGEDYDLRHDLRHIVNVLNSLQRIIELESQTSDPTVTASSDKNYLWVRTDTSPPQIRVDINGTTYKVDLTAA